MGVGLQGQFGMIGGGQDLAATFDNGPGLAVRLRYRMRYERAMGLSFEQMRLETRQPGADSTGASLELTVTV